MRVRSVPALLALLLVTFAVGGTAADLSTVDGPRLVRGDYWTYHTNTTFASGLSLEGRVTVAVTDRSTIAVEGTPYDAYNLSLSGSGIAAGTFVTQIGSWKAAGSW